jgi:hypothetical protein
MTAEHFHERAEWCAALAREMSDRVAADGLRIDAAAYLVRADRINLRKGILGHEI